MIRFAKMDPTVYVMHYRGGTVVREGAGLSFLYFAPTSTIVAIPLNTTDLPFAFQEVTADFQTVTLQGQLSYRVREPRKLAALLNYAVDQKGEYLTDDPTKLAERLLMAAQSTMRAMIQGAPLRVVLADADGLTTRALGGLKASALAAEHGLEMLGFSLVAVRPTPETAKALEAQAREALLREADQAIYARRTAAVEQERKVKESELETERAVEERRRQVRESKMGADIAIEEQRAALVDQRVANDRKDSDSRAYALESSLAPLKGVDWRMLLALGGGDGKLLLAQAFERLADNAGKIGQLNITPDLLSCLAGDKK